MGSFAWEQEWVERLGRLPDVVRQYLVATQLSAHVRTAPARVLDVGCGQGSQALALARAGHSVTGLDVSAELLGRFEATLADEPAEVRVRVRLVGGAGQDARQLTPGPFDVLLCHGVLMYLEDVRPMLAALTEVAAGGALLSLLVRNGAAPAMRDGLRGNWQCASDAFDGVVYTNRDGLSARGHTPEQIHEATAAFGWRPLTWYGVRVFTDHRDEPAPPSHELEPMLAAELEAGSRDPYRRVAGLFHLLYER